MNILKISFDKNFRKYMVETDEETFYVFESTFVKFNLYVGKELDSKLVNSLNIMINFMKLRPYHLNF